jgi:hypothetical protein
MIDIYEGAIPFWLWGWLLLFPDGALTGGFVGEGFVLAGWPKK